MLDFFYPPKGGKREPGQDLRRVNTLGYGRPRLESQDEHKLISQSPLTREGNLASLVKELSIYLLPNNYVLICSN